MNTSLEALSKIKPNKANPMVIKDSKFHKLVNSILVFPKMLEARPIVVNNEMVVLGGNMRLKALETIKSMDEKEIRDRLGSQTDFTLKPESERESLISYWLVWKDKPQTYVVKAKDFSDAEQKQFIVKDNASFGEWDFDALSTEFDVQSLGDWGVDIASTPNFDFQSHETGADEYIQADIDEGIESNKEEGHFSKEYIEDTEDNYDEANVDASALKDIKLGDVWRLGSHTLICGDCTEVKVLDEVCEDGSVDMLLTDPPYGVTYENSNGRASTTRIESHIENDDLRKEALCEFLKASLSNANRKMRSGAGFYVWHAETQKRAFMDAIESVWGQWRSNLVWVKPSLTLGHSDYQWRHEPCLYGWKDGGGKFFTSDRTQTTVLEFSKTVCDIHPTMKPVPLFAKLINNSTRQGDTIIDIFAGSGTSIIAAEQLGRKCIAVELSPHYCAQIINRWEALTSREAEKIKNIEQTL